jgi:P4 family phage/plasmid primase-like protien
MSILSNHVPLFNRIAHQTNPVFSFQDCYPHGLVHGSNPRPAEDEGVHKIAGWLRQLTEPGQVVELRAHKVSDPNSYRSWPQTWNGFFDPDHFEDLARHALELTTRAEAIWFTLNPLNPALLNRRMNRVDVAAGGDCSTDQDVSRRRWLLIDADAKRVGGVSSSDVEKAAAHKVAEQIRDYLDGKGWPRPVFADSGNGFHLLYRVDLPAADGELLKKVLTELAAKFNTDQVTIDPKVANPGRVVKLYGTMARKGDHSSERPHRWTEVLEIPNPLTAVPKELLDALVAESKEPARPERKAAQVNGGKYAVDRELVRQRARAYLDKVPSAVSGQGGHDRTFAAACALVLGFDLTVEEALPLLGQWNETCQPPWTEKELRHKLEDADKQPGERGYLLTSSRSSGINKDDADSSAEPVKQDDDPHRLARILLQEDYTHRGTVTLRFWQDQWWEWADGAYRLLGEKELRARIWSGVEKEFNRLNLAKEEGRTAANGSGRSQRGSAPYTLKVSTGLVANVLNALSGEVLVAETVKQPAWLPDVGPAVKHDYIALRNGLLSLKGLLAGNPQLVPHSPRWFCPVCLPYDFDPTAQCPKWEKFLQRNLENDQDRIALLQEWFGYCLVNDTSHQKFLVLEGEGSNGKSVVCAALTAMLGEPNVSNVPLEAFGQRFALTGTIGRLANIASEVGELDKMAEGLLKSFTAGDRMTFDRKGISPIEALPTARLVLATNNKPRFSDRSGGIWRRMLLMPFRVEIGAGERVYGMDKAQWWADEGELPGIFNWAVDGLRRLRRQNRFTETQVCKDAQDQYRADCSPARSFLLETCREEAGSQVPTQTLYEQYRRWCQENGYQALGERQFGKEVFRTYPTAKKRKLGGRNDRLNVYEGIKFLGPPPRDLWHACQGFASDTLATVGRDLPAEGFGR